MRMNLSQLNDRVQKQEARREEIRKRLRVLSAEAQLAGAPPGPGTLDAMMVETRALAAELASMDADLVAWAAFTEGA